LKQMIVSECGLDTGGGDPLDRIAYGGD
jgi:hypothetical protein